MDINKKPLVSIIAVAYNHEDYVEDAVNSLLNQDYSPLEIIISDDNSTDSTFQIVEEIVATYKGPHKVIINKNSTNLGIGGNVSTALKLANGDLLVSADCDDISESHRVSELVKVWLAHDSKPQLITTDAWDTAQNGEDIYVKRCGDLQEIRSIDDWMKKKPHFFGCTNFYTKNLIENFGYLQPNCGATDQIMVLRAILMGSAISYHTPLVHHRQGGVTGNKPMNVVDKINRLTKESSRTIADIEQHTFDAKKMGMEDKLKKHFKDQLAEARLIPKLLNAKSLKEEVKIFFQEKNTPLLKKIRLLSYASLPFMHRVFFKIKRGVKK